MPGAFSRSLLFRLLFTFSTDIWRPSRLKICLEVVGVRGGPLHAHGRGGPRVRPLAAPRADHPVPSASDD